MTSQKVVFITLGITVILAVGALVAFVANEYLQEQNITSALDDLSTTINKSDEPSDIMSSKDGFFIKFPSEPITISKKEFSFEGADMNLNIYSVQENEAIYSVSVANLFGIITSPDEFDLQGVVNGIAGSDGSNILSQSAVSIEGYKGIKYLIKADGSYLDGFSFFDGLRAYSIIVNYPASELTIQEDINSFFSSFKLTK